jgi:hypothetical protein
MWHAVARHLTMCHGVSHVLSMVSCLVRVTSLDTIIGFLMCNISSVIGVVDIVRLRVVGLHASRTSFVVRRTIWY